jgi:hypothetical protein
VGWLLGHGGGNVLKKATTHKTKTNSITKKPTKKKKKKTKKRKKGKKRKQLYGLTSQKKTNTNNIKMGNQEI